MVLGVSPTRAETGYGYIEQGFVDAALAGMELEGCEGLRVRRVKRFTEKPDPERAEEFVGSGNYAWNSGIFIWSARTLAEAIREHCPAMAPHLERIAAAYGTPEFERGVCGGVSAVPEHLDRLCGAGAAVGEGRAGERDLLSAGGLWLERSGLVGVAA